MRVLTGAIAALVASTGAHAKRFILRNPLQRQSMAVRRMPHLP